jgi:hypothetical protein
MGAEKARKAAKIGEKRQNWVENAGRPSAADDRHAGRSSEDLAKILR